MPARCARSPIVNASAGRAMLDLPTIVWLIVMASHKEPNMPTAEYPYRHEGWDTQIYPMPSFAVLVVSDLEASSEWYRTALGFADVFTLRMADGKPVIVHLRWCTFADLLLTPARAPLAAEPGAG